MKRSEKTSKKIVHAALELFVRRGYHGTTIDDIMRKTGLTKGAFYFHFSTKGEMLLRIIEEFKIRYVDELIRSGSEYPGNALEKFHHIVTFNARFSYEYQDLCVFLTFLTTELKADVNFEPALKSVYKEFYNYIRQLIKQGISQGIFRKELDPGLAAHIYLAMHDGALHQWVLNMEFLDGKQYMKTFREMFLYGLVNQSVEQSFGLEIKPKSSLDLKPREA